jgi:hypothetical protein
VPSGVTALFSESPSRFLVEVPSGRSEDFERVMSKVPRIRVGQVTEGNRVTMPGVDATIDDLKAAWKRPLQW